MSVHEARSILKPDSFCHECLHLLWHAVATLLHLSKALSTANVDYKK